MEVLSIKVAIPDNSLAKGPRGKEEGAAPVSRSP